MALIEKLPANATSVSLAGQAWIPLSKLAAHDEFEKLVEASSFFFRIINNPKQSINIPKLQNEVDSQKTYLQRKEEIESKGAEKKNKISSRIRDLRSRIAALRTTKLNELLRLNADRMKGLFENFGENGELARFLILEGHLDDTYYQYTSLFHSGRLSPNDNRFLIQIRAFITPDPGFPIDNPKEVIAAMRNEDFRQSYILNVKLVDILMNNRDSYLGQTRMFFEFLSSEFESCEDFFVAYYASGLNVVGLILGLVKAWEGFVPAVIASSNNISHVTQLVLNTPESFLEGLARKFEELPYFVSENLSEILVNAPELAPERLVCLGFEVKDLAEIKEHSEVVRLMFEKGLFELTIPNLEYVYQVILGESDLEKLSKRNFTTIRLTNNTTLIRRVERDFDLYLRDILLSLQGNSEEDASAILNVVRHDELDQDDLREFLHRQTTQLPSLEEVPEKLYSMMFSENVIEPTWDNCLAFMSVEGFEADNLIDYLDQDVIRAAILQHSIPNEPESNKLRIFLFEAGSLSDIAYKDYARALPRPIKVLPERLEPPKIQILIDEGKVSFTKKNLDALSDKKGLEVRFVAANVDVYLSDPENFSLDDDFREELLQSDIDDSVKLKIVKLMDLEALVDLPERSALIGSILSNKNAELLTVDGCVAQSIIINSTPIEIQISLLNKYHSRMSDGEVRHVLSNLSRPFSEIKTGYYRPRLESTLENQVLVKWLKSRNFISSWSEDRFPFNTIRVYPFRK